MSQKTHRSVIKPQLSVRKLADYMAGTETARRTIIRDCKYPPIARVVSHREARASVSRHIWSGAKDTTALKAKSEELRARLSDCDFDRDLLDHNADYIDRFAAISTVVNLPDADVSAPGSQLDMTLNAVRVTGELAFRLRRRTKTNKIKIGAGTLRYAKGKALAPAVGDWQSSIVFGMLSIISGEDEAQPERGLCLTLDAYSGICHPAASDSVSRFNNAQAACATIAERWPNIPAPKGAVI